MLATLVHTLHPMAIEIGNGFGIRWYGLAYAAGFFLAWLVMRWMAKTQRILLTPEQVADLMTYLIAGVIVGGRVGHVVFYEPQLLTTFHPEFPWWGLLDIHRGGMSSHGGIVGTIIASALFARRIGVPALHVIDAMAFVSPMGLSLGRLANWVNGELPGRVLPTTMQGAPPWWSVKYPSEVLNPGFDHSRLEPLAKLVDPSHPLPDALYDAAYSGRHDVIAALEPVLTAHYPNNFIQATTDGPLLLMAMAVVWLRPRKPGAVAATFLVAYGGLRMGSEQFREIDEGVLMVGPLTLPMVLSLSMIVIGVALAVWSMRQPAPLVGGLLASRAVQK
jgi:phosphatidylglycerol:prolipoprotein diacylglycerol transferase